jgi:FkbM family methyltransferase
MQKCVFNDSLCFSINSDLEEYRINSIFEKEPETIAWIDSICNSDSVFYDIGANIGIYTLYMNYKNPMMQIFCFEPVQNNFNSLQNNIILNSALNVHPFNIALSNNNMITNLFISDTRNGNSGAQIEAPINEKGDSFEAKKIEKILSFSLDYLVNNLNFPQPNFIKIDVDGHENEILDGMKATLENEQLKSLLIEFNDDNQFQKWQSDFNKIGLYIDEKFDNVPNNSSLRRSLKGSTTRNYIFQRK